MHNARINNLAYDLGHDWAADQEQPPNTYRKGGVFHGMEDGTRIDTILSNAVGAAAVRHYQLDLDASHGYDHTYMYTTIDAEHLDYHVRTFVKPTPLPLPDTINCSAPQRKELMQRCHDLYKSTWAKYHDILV